MQPSGTQILKAALTAAHVTGAHRLLAPLTRGRGVIFMLHNVTPQPPEPFEPNSILKVTPAFLEAVIGEVKSCGYEIVSLDEIEDRLAPSYDGPPFACFTLDDGYRDNRDHAYPVFKRHTVPFTIYVPETFGDGGGDLWWLVLEAAIARAPHVSVEMNGRVQTFNTATTAAKSKAFHRIYWWLRTLPERGARSIVGELARAAGYDPSPLCRSLVMSFDELRELARDPLVTIGAHTVGHFALAKLSDREAEHEMAASITRIEREFGRPCRHFSYPYGCAASAGPREFALAARLGIKTAVTTRKGLLFSHHAQTMTALPRLSLNGAFQDIGHVRVLLSGAPFALLNALKRA